MLLNNVIHLISYNHSLGHITVHIDLISNDQAKDIHFHMPNMYLYKEAMQKMKKASSQ